jgi:hypothetical protein
LLRAKQTTELEGAEALGIAVAKELVQQGAELILNSIPRTWPRAQ